MAATPDDYFATDYGDARRKFLAACRTAGAAVESHRNPAPGPDGAALYTDVARIGPKTAARVLLIISGTHGAEGFAGSAIQVGLLDPAGPLHRPANKSPDVAVVFVHALNPHGFAWLRRVTEDNVDLNRNFVDHAAGDYPSTPGYDALAAALTPPAWDDATIAATGRVLQDYADAHGLLAMQAAVCGGQYGHPTGLFYGGRAPTWSRHTLERIVATELSGVRLCGSIDVHTGLGPYGYGEPIAMHAHGSAGLAQVQAWYGDTVTSPDGGTSSSPVVAGHLGTGLERAAPATRWANIALEFGTQSVDDVLQALRADTWLHHHGDVASAHGQAIKGQIRAAFYGDESAWKAKVWARGAELASRALAGLAAA